MWLTIDRSRLASLGLPRSLHLTPVDHIVSGWGQMQGAPSFGPGKRGGSARCNRSLVRSPPPSDALKSSLWMFNPRRA